MADDVVVGPGCVLRGAVKIGPGCELAGFVWIEGDVTLGAGNRLFPNVTIGCQAQDLRGNPTDPTSVVIGDGNTFREGVTVHRGTRAGGGVTRIGNRCMLMVDSHVGHDARLQDNIVLINNTTIAGHCLVEQGAWLSGFTGLHQFTTVGRYSFTAAFAGADRDVPPYCRVEHVHPLRCSGVNVVGLRRLGLSVETIRELRDVLEAIFPRGELSLVDRDAMASIAARGDLSEYAQCLVDFVQRSSAHRFGRQREAGRHAAAAAAREAEV
ncbi:MAG: Acyl-[acyl-carrier-protein]--UDP-N-acetylglucosamine O-acyltransferase [Phycisphaerae bacterium]|nr:Acyl-[acyl-carrier-protein]--UDP-N-acetylglucosamine O-acyltransferase [Phycisphaerae bacterium]